MVAETFAIALVMSDSLSKEVKRGSSSYRNTIIMVGFGFML